MFNSFLFFYLNNYKYLDAIFDKDSNLSRDFHTMQVVLYAEYQRDKLLKFLQNSQYIILAQAQKELQERNLVPEIVYILERMGQIKKALQLILHAIKDVNQAIEFCKKHNDKDLWEDLINYSLNKPEYIIGLLNNIGTHVNPVDLIDRIPNGVKIKGLRDALVKILQDYRVQLSLLEGSKNIISGDCFNLMKKKISVVKHGISVEGVYFYFCFK
jgi:vacuolar protein sorting-associated protein 41